MPGVHRPRPPRPPAPSTSAASITSASKHLQQPAPLSKRLLFPHLPPISDVPPLFATTVPSELNHESYEFIALSLRAFVHPWWSKITRYDKELLPDITRILTVCIRALEVRALAVDLPTLVCKEIPALVTQHFRDYRNAQAKLSTSYATGGAAPLPQIFHQLQPHIAVSADGMIDEEYFRQILDHILKACLPPEDYDAEPERFIIREVILKVLLKDILANLTQPWYIHRLLLDLIGIEEEMPLPKVPEIGVSSRSLSPPPFFSFHSFLIAILSAMQTFSSICLAVIHAYKQTFVTIKRVNQANARSPSTIPLRAPRSRRSVSLPLLHTTTPTSERGAFSTSSSASTSTSPRHSTQSIPDESYSPPSPTDARMRNLSWPLVMMATEIFTIHERFASSIMMSSFLMLCSATGPFIDRFLLHTISAALSPAFITQMVRTAKRTLFPNGYAATLPSDPTPEEQAAMRERLVRWKPPALLAHLTPFILGHQPDVTLSAALDPLSSVPCNSHLAVLILDRLILALFPELGFDSSNT